MMVTTKIKIEKPTEEQKRELLIPSTPIRSGPWSVWQCEPSIFNWQYSETETAYVFEGKVRVTTPDEEMFITQGDLVVFPRGLQCTWQVLEKICKVYKFG